MQYYHIDYTNAPERGKLWEIYVFFICMVLKGGYLWEYSLLLKLSSLK